MGNDTQKITLPKSLYDRIENDVVKLHIELGLTIPVDPYKIVKKLGYRINYFSDITDPEMIKELINTTDGAQDGLSYYDASLETYVIWINDIDSSFKPRVKFTIMHEIGHIRMGHRHGSALAEVIANYYAAYALVPSPLPFMLNCNSCIDIIDTFDVSMDCAFYSETRCMNWDLYCGKLKTYEKELIKYYKEAMNIE